MRRRCLAVLPLLAGLLQGQPAPDFASKADEVIRSFKFRGAVGVFYNGEPVFRKGYGMANEEWDIPNAPDTKFRLGSITKQFTAIAILQLAEAGKLSLHDPVAKHYEAPASWKKITVEHLLNHTSGIPSYTSLPGFFQKSSRDALTPVAIVNLTQDMPLEFEPGSQFKYNNTGYVLLGHLIEKISGIQYDAYVKQKILDPAGMSDSGYDWSSTVLKKRASGYTPDGKNAPYLDMSLPHAAGSLYSTIDDFVKWDRMLHGVKLISPESWKKMTTPGKGDYGYGLWVKKVANRPSVGHGGGINGFNTFFARFPEDRVAIAVFSNQNGSAPPKMGEALAQLYFNGGN